MLYYIAALIVQMALLFVISTTLFDVVHWLLHRWQRSRWAILRTFSSWHQVHHDFLDKQMQVHPELAWRNFWAHLLPEYLTSVGGTVVFFPFVEPIAVIIIVAIHTVLFGFRIVGEGMDPFHMAMDRLHGKRGVFMVNASYHAMHHINPMGFYSSFLNVFDMIMGTAVALRGKRVMLTGFGGAFGNCMAALLVKAGATVYTVSLRDMLVKDIEALPLADFDILVMCHGLKHGEPSEIWRANSAATAYLGDTFITTNRNKLVPPEIWSVGSEAEVFGFDDYAMSKRFQADYARHNWHDNADVTYRHIVPSAFTSRMGRGLITANAAARWSLFLIRRGFRYVPVTYTGLAFINWLRYKLS